MLHKTLQIISLQIQLLLKCVKLLAEEETEQTENLIIKIASEQR